MPAVPRARSDVQDATVTQLHPGRDVVNVMLGEFLRQCREERRLNQSDLATVIRGSVSKISRLERGESPAKERDVLDLADFMRLDAEERQTIHRLLDGARNEAWYQQFSDVTPTYLKRLIALEGLAVAIMAYENQVVPGLLQTPAYARSLVKAVRENDWEVERAVEMRMRRQKILRENTSLRLTALIDQGVLLRARGGAAAMRQQLEYLLEVAERKKVNVRIVPFARGADVTPPYAITQLEFAAEGPSDLVYVERLNAADYLTNVDIVDKYRRDLHQLHDAAAGRVESQQLIRKAIEDHYS
ncbi:helix-turn-helix domain-containing protein [Streptomyces griseus]|uniref:helix-turn-helix domain-containing protein n=1 Tax=Streptomyces griseus TaxID=1911 RepID=UPI0033B199D8